METRNEYVAGAYFTLDGKGQILTADIIDSNLFGLDEIRLNNRSLADFVDPSDRGLFSAYCAETSRANTRRSCQLRLLTNNNSVSLPVKIESHPILGQERDATLLRTVVVKVEDVEEAGEALGKKNEIYTVALRKAGIGTWEWDTATGRLWWSEITESIFGFFPGEFDRTYDAFLDCVHPEDREGVAASVTKCVEAGRDFCIEHRVVKPDGSVCWVLETGDVIRDSQGNVVRMAGIVQDITDQKRQRDQTTKMKQRLERLVRERTIELMEANKSLHEEIAERKQTERELLQKESDLKGLSAKLVDAQEDERKRVARELHDSIAGKLSAIKYGVEKKLGEMEEAPSGGISLEDVLSEVKEAIEETRRISRNLWPSQLEDLGLIPSIDGLIRQFSGHYPGLEAIKEIDVDENEIPKRLKIAVYRILQEALNNAGKYSGATEVEVSLMRKNSNLEFCLKDNGQGFDPETVLNPQNGSGKGMGLESMKERTEVSGGAFSIWSKPGEGTAVFATWRLDSEP